MQQRTLVDYRQQFIAIIPVFCLIFNGILTTVFSVSHQIIIELAGSIVELNGKSVVNSGFLEPFKLIDSLVIQAEHAESLESRYTHRLFLYGILCKYRYFKGVVVIQQRRIGHKRFVLSAEFHRQCQSPGIHIRRLEFRFYAVDAAILHGIVVLHRIEHQIELSQVTFCKPLGTVEGRSKTYNGN